MTDLRSRLEKLGVVVPERPPNGRSRDEWMEYSLALESAAEKLAGKCEALALEVRAMDDLKSAMGLFSDGDALTIGAIKESFQVSAARHGTERAKGFVQPVRRSYRHTGERPKFPLRDLTRAETDRYGSETYTKFEAYPASATSAILGRFWSEAQLKSGCGNNTTMGKALAETYAREPKFYGSTFCCTCRSHFPVAEFTWSNDGSQLGS